MHVAIEDLVEIHPELAFMDDTDPFVHVPSGIANPAPWASKILVDTVHDGWIIPERFVEGLEGEGIEQVERVYRHERDWGAHWVANRLAEKLSLAGSYRVSIARALLDFNRFPGSSPESAEFLGRLSINPPFSQILSYGQKSDLLHNYYDRISQGMDAVVDGRLLKIAVHTYDPANESGTERPAVSLITRSRSYQMQATMPLGGFDALFPSVLGEFMSDRVLTYRIALALEQNRVPVIMNFPYLLPDGGVEVRSQVWLFFRHLKRAYEAEHRYEDPDEEAAFSIVWTMLLDTNSRSTASAAFREYVHGFGRAPGGLEDFFERGRLAYESVRAHLQKNYRELVDTYRYSRTRPSSLAVEVRKDYIWELEEGRPVRLKLDEAERAVEGIARGIELYLKEDVGLESLEHVTEPT